MLSLFTILRRKPRLVGLKRDEVVLTFDDGPNLRDDVTQTLLDVLQQHSVRAAFCVVGREVLKAPALIRRMQRDGHLIVNHTFTHTHPWRQSTDSLLNEMRRCDEAIGAVLGVTNYRSEYCRVPFGIVTIPVRRMQRRLDLKPVLLTHYGWDTRVGPLDCDEVVEGLMANARQKRGGMFVLHDGICGPEPESPEPWARSCRNRSWVPAAVDRIIRELSATGLRFVLPDQHQTVTATVAFPSAANDRPISRAA